MSPQQGTLPALQTGTPATPVPPYINLGPPAGPTENGHRVVSAQPAPEPQPKSPLRKLSPQRLIILCDGTWQARLDVEAHETTGSTGRTPTGKDGWLSAGRFFTNVSLLAQVLEPVGKDQAGNEVRQTVLYQTGIGTVPNAIGRYVEGATGCALPEKVMEAYGFICDNYRPVGPGEEPDSIFLFGFSRGAYTARTIAGFLAWAGVMTRQQCSTHFKAIWEAYEARNASDPDTLAHADDVLFQRLGKYPSPSASHAAQIAKDNAAHLETSFLTKSARRLSSFVSDPLSLRRTRGWTEEFRPTERDPALCAVAAPIEVVGVWDTVGALGTPGNFALPELARYHTFFDPMPAPTIKYAFHALALGEDRQDFSPTLWVLPPGPALTSEGELAFDTQYKLERVEDTRLRQAQTVRQVWFKGTHTDVGGGHSWHGLSDITLAWMVGQLVDSPDGPLLSINIDKLRDLQDRRRAWGRQPEHPSRGALQFQKHRSVLPYADSKVKAKLEAKNHYWRNVIEAGNTYESLHFSVTLGDEYLFDDGGDGIPPGAKGKGIPAVFRNVARISDARYETKLREMWVEAQRNPPTGTEAKLMWSLEEPQLQATSCTTIAGFPVAPQICGPEVDLELRPQRPHWMPPFVWQMLINVLELPLRASVVLANILNGREKFWQLHERNLRPLWTTRLIQASKMWPAKLRSFFQHASASRHPKPRSSPASLWSAVSSRKSGSSANGSKANGHSKHD